MSSNGGLDLRHAQRQLVTELGQEHVRASIFAERVALALAGTMAFEFAFWRFAAKPFTIYTMMSRPFIGMTITAVATGGVLVYAAVRAWRIKREWLRARRLSDTL